MGRDNKPLKNWLGVLKEEQDSGASTEEAIARADKDTKKKYGRLPEENRFGDDKKGKPGRWGW